MRLPLVLHTPLPGTNIPPPSLMKRAYQAISTRARNMLLPDWTTDAPTPPYYDFPPSLIPHPFMGLRRFVAGRIDQMRAAKSYLAAHRSWFDENQDPTCPRCGTEPETLTHAILSCLTQTRVRDLLLKEVFSLGPDADLWTDPLLI